MPLTIPNNALLPEPQSPWRMSPGINHRLEQLPGHKFRSCQILDSDAEYPFVLRYFMQSKPPGYSLSKITCVVNPVQTHAFESELESFKDQSVAVIPLWQGNTAQQCLSICNVGYTDFEKPDDGIYFTTSAHGASLDNSGHLLLSWVATSNPIEPGQYGDKVIVFKASQAVTRFWVELAVDLPRAPVRPADIEGDLFRQLLQAHAGNRFEEQVACITQIGDLYFQKGEWLKAALILNSAVAICQKHLNNLDLESTLFDRLANCETLFLESKGYKASHINRETLLKYRTQLHEIRKRQLSRTDAPVPQIMIDLTRNYRELLSSLIQDVMTLLGPPPVQWTCIGLGSMAREEMCPYSDIECAFLLKDETPEALTYFRILAQLLQIRMVNLGETEFVIFGSRFHSPTPKGYSLDTGGNTPLGKPGLYELITTPQKLAEYQTPHWMEADIILVNALNTVCWVTGDRTLLVDYESAKKKKLNYKEGWFTGVPFRSQLAHRLLEGHLIEFKPELSQGKEDISAFGIKKELYRPLQSILSSLALYHGIDVANITQIIEALRKKGVLSPVGAGHLQEALSAVLTLRFNAHKFYQREEEYLCHRKEDEQVDPNLLYLEEPQIKVLANIYQVLLPLHKCASDSAFDRAKWKKCSFYDDGPLARGNALKRALLYADVQEAYQQAVALNPNDVDALLSLGNIENDLANFDEASRRHLKALELAKQKYGENDISVARGYGHLGNVHFNRGNYDQALQCYQKALEIQLQLFGEKDQQVATSYNNIGTVYYSRGENAQAREFFQKALTIQLQLSGENHLSMAPSYNNLGMVSSTLGENDKALEFYHKALEIFQREYGENHPDVATSYSNMGVIYKSKSEHEKALDVFKKSLKIRLQRFGEDHPDVAISYNNMGVAYRNLGKNDKALEFSRKALKIFLQAYGENHPSVAVVYTSIASAYEKRGDKEKALEFRNKAAQIKEKAL